MTTYLWGIVKDKLIAEDLSLENENELAAQFSCRKYRLTSRGKMLLESKEEMKKRGIESPDRADGYKNLFNKYGTKDDVSEQYRFESENPVTDMELTINYEENGLFAQIIDIPSNDAVSSGFSYGISDINHLALVGEARAGESARLNIDGKDDRITLKGGKATMYKVNQKENRADSGSELSPEEMEVAIALFKAQEVAEQATGEEMDGEEVPEGKEENNSEEEKNPIEKVRENIERRDSQEGNISPEDIINQQKADLEVLLSEIDKIQASSDMNGEDRNE